MAVNRLLVLDDDSSFRRLLAEVGRRARYDVTEAASVDDFLRAYQAVNPSLLILDLQYEEGDGIGVMTSLAQQRCTAPIILVSGFDPRVLETSRRVGESYGLTVVGALSKPVRLPALMELLVAHREPELDEWAGEIRAALEQGQLAVVYQPKVDLVDGRVGGFEALARWSHPTRGPIGPDRFIPLAVATGMIGPLTEYVLDRAIADAVGWGAAGFEVSVAVNIAAPTLAGVHVVEDFTQMLARHGLPARRLTLEVTESTAMENATRMLEVLGRLRLQGFTLSLDDFGTGFSNLGLLHRMPFNELKIDRSFVMDALANRDSEVIVRALTGLAKSLGLAVVAEGVEDLDVWRWLQSLHVEQGQGYGIARPMPAEQVLPWLGAYTPPQFSAAGEPSPGARREPGDALPPE